MEQTVGMAEAKSKLAELVGQVRYGGNRYILERRGQPMAMLIGIEEYEQLMARVSEKDRSKSTPLSPELQRRQRLLVERARRLQEKHGDPVAGLADFFSKLPPEEDSFWFEIEEAR
jgi:prevent-host-death family protein